MDEKLKKILDSISILFIKYGIKSVTMDDISSHLGMSKKTLYTYFDDKKDLVQKIVTYHINFHNSKFKQTADKGENAIDVLLNASRNLVQFLEEFTPTVCYDLKKYYPEINKILSEHKGKHIFDNVKLNILKGIQEGLYRKDINPEIIARIYVTRIETIFNNEIFPLDKFSLIQLFDEAFKYHIHGIANNKGLEYYEKKLKNVKSHKTV